MKKKQTFIFYPPLRFFSSYSTNSCEPGQDTLKEDRNYKSGSGWLVPLDPSMGC